MRHPVAYDKNPKVKNRSRKNLIIYLVILTSPVYDCCINRKGYFMQRKMQSKTIRKNAAARTSRPRVAKQNTHRIWRTVAWIAGAIALIGIIALIWWRASTSETDDTKLTATATAPAVQTFTDDNTMFFATQNSIPDVNNDRELTPPADAMISYTLESGPYAPAFKMNLVDADLSDQVKITPFIRGTWHFRGSNNLSFAPDGTWPAGTKFTVRINPALINDDVRDAPTRFTFTTPDITATVDNFNLYPALDDAKSVIGVAVISFDYEIDTTDFADKVSMKLDDKKLDFTVKFDRFRRTAFIISAPVKITNNAQIMRVKLNRIPALDGDSRTQKLTANVTVDAADNIFKISSLDTTVADDNDGNAQQLILLDTTTAARDNTDWSQYITVYLLPTYRDDEERTAQRVHIWADDEITEDVLSESKKLDIKQMDFATARGVYQYAFSYDVSDKQTRYIYVDVKPGALSATGFEMKNGDTSVMRVPYPTASVQIAGSGALLSLAGGRELGIVARGGVDTAYVNLYKVKSEEINHLISQTYNVFASNMEFKSWAFGVYDMSVVFQKRISFVNPSMKSANYASIDLGDYLDRTYGDNTGIFIIQTGTSENAAEYNDKRLILLTDLGIIRKVNMDNSSVVFVSNLSTGTPAADVEISVLGRNGNNVWAGRTDANGRAEIPALPWSEYRNAREPVAIVARRGDDIAFIPYNAYNQHVEYSKFDVDGVYASASTPLNAFMFSDRGIYRPGEQLVLGGIVKNKSFKSLAGIPVRLQMRDARGRITLEKTFSLTADGLFDIEYKIPDDATLGTWNTYLYSLTANDKLADMLGTVTFDVQEFVPDTMKITANIAGASENGGWVAPSNLRANVSLRNLFGTPATNRRIAARATLTPVEYSFDNFAGYKFTPNFISDTGLSTNTARRIQTYSVELPDMRTDDNGAATLDIQFDRTIPSGTYTLALNVRGFESNSGTSVQTNITTRVSDAKYLVGWRADGDTSYINKNTVRKIKLIAVDHTAIPIAADGLKLRILRRENQTTLVKDYNNYYKYQTVSRDKTVSQTALDIPADGTTITLNTKTGGTYFMQVLDAADKILASAEYYVAGDENVSMISDTPADLQIKLDASEYAPGDDIAVSITAPYTGAGLITIERDKVYAYKWFNTKSTSSVQHITVPAGFEGTGYVNVSFVRDINSRDIFTTPYAYAVAPFSADTSARKIDIKLNTPDVVRDNKLTVQYKTNRDARIMLFAVNTGILQVANYQIPNPLAHFFQKSALQVNTYQILSLLLPEYKILREYAKTGGGDYGGDGAVNQIQTNPFGRRTQAPVAFYSKILNAHANATDSVTFDIPEYFNGAVRVFAVAANTSAVGAADTEVYVQSPIVISTSAPLFAAPNDTFEINSVVTNMTENSGANAKISLAATTSGGLNLTGATTMSDTVAENAEKLFTFPVRATDTLGNAEIKLNATLNTDDKTLATRENTTTLSVRPITTYTTNITSGIVDSHDTTVSDFNIDMYPEFATRHLYVSHGAGAMAMPLFEYLAHYDYPCTEQLVSRTIPYAVMPDNKILGTTRSESAKKIADTVNTLRNRQNDDGSFALWSGGATTRDNRFDSDTAYLTAYVAQFLTIARDAGFTVPTQMLSRAVDFLRTFAGGNIIDAEYARAAAYAIYVISENGYVTTSYIDALTQYADENIKNWRETLTGAYIAAAYKILKQDDLARDLISEYSTSRNTRFEYSAMFDNNVANDAMYYYLTNKLFASQNPTESDVLREYVKSGTFDAYTSAVVIMALAGDSTAAVKTGDITVTTNSQIVPVVTDSADGVTAEIPADATKINITCAECNDATRMYYTLVQQGYPTESRAATNGLDVTREYYNADGDRITQANIGDIVTVRISARTRGGTDIAENVAITDLLPGGFIANADSVTGTPEYFEVREDRVLIYADLTREVTEFTYTVQVGASGTFAIPAISAESMYNPQIRATGRTGTFTVLNETSER